MSLGQNSIQSKNAWLEVKRNNTRLFFTWIGPTARVVTFGGATMISLSFNAGYWTLFLRKLALLEGLQGLFPTSQVRLKHKGS